MAFLTMEVSARRPWLQEARFRCFLGPAGPRSTPILSLRLPERP